MTAAVMAQLIAKWKATAGAADSADTSNAYARCAFELEDALDRLGILPLPEGDPRNG